MKVLNSCSNVVMMLLEMTLIRGNPNIVTNFNEHELLHAIKRLAVIPVVIIVHRPDLLSFPQCHCESIHTFFAQIKEKAATCAYIVDCP